MEPTTSGRIRCAVYLRQSLDASGEQLAVQRQRDDVRATTERRGWDVCAEYADNDISASGKKVRPGFEQLLADIQAGSVDVVVAWSLDRLTRNRRDTVRLIEACQAHGTTIALVRGSDIDMSTPAGRLTADILASVARHEIEQKGDRQRAAAFQRAQRGKPPLGTRLTAYTPTGEVVEHEAAVVRGLFARFAAGDSLRSLAGWLTESGVPTRHGRPWNPSSVRGILINPRYAGRAVYKGAQLEQQCSWEAIVEPDVFELVASRLADPRRKTQVGTDRKHLGAGLYECGPCGRLVTSWTGNRYRCPEGCLTRTQGPVDALVLAAVRGRLARSDLAEMLAPVQSPADQALAAQITALRTRLVRIGDDYDAGMIDGQRYKVAKAKAQAELSAARAVQSRAATATGLTGVLSTGDPVATFDAAPLMIRRSVIDALCVVKLAPAPRGSHTFDRHSLGDSHWRGDTKTWAEIWESE